MHGEDGPGVDLDEVADVIARTEVLIIGFSACAERLLVDLRADAVVTPLVELVEPLRNAQERARWLADRRPSLGAPERSVFFGWPHSIDFLETCGLLEGVCERIRSEHGIDVDEDVRAVLRQLRERERDLVARAIRGDEGFDTLWSTAG